MGEHKIPKDPVDAAIDTVDAQEQANAEAVAAAEASGAEFPSHFVANWTANEGDAKMRLIVPHDFTSDLFETAVGILIQLRLAAEQKKAAEANSGLIVPDPKPKLIAVDGRRLQ